MKVKLNGNGTDLKDSLTVSDLLECLQIEPARVAVEVNLEIVKKQDYQKRMLKDSDSIEIVNFVGGG